MFIEIRLARWVRSSFGQLDETGIEVGLSSSKTGSSVRRGGPWGERDFIEFDCGKAVYQMKAAR